MGLILFIVFLQEIVHVVIEGIVEDTGSDFVDCLNDEMLVVNTRKHFGGDFINFEKVMEVGGGVILAKFAIAIGADR